MVKRLLISLKVLMVVILGAILFWIILALSPFTYIIFNHSLIDQLDMLHSCIDNVLEE